MRSTAILAALFCMGFLLAQAAPSPGLAAQVIRSGIKPGHKPPFFKPAPPKPIPRNLDPTSLSLRQGFDAAKRGKVSSLARIERRTKNEVAARILRWLRLRAPNSGAGFAEITGFIAAHPSWPRLRDLFKRAEAAMGPAMSERAVLAWFARHPPRTTPGHVRLGAAVLATGDKAGATRILRETWIKRNFGARKERIFYKRYRRHLEFGDHIKRLDRLLWESRYYPTRRMYRRINRKYRALAEARLSLRRMTGGVDRAIARVPLELRSDPGLVYERLCWRRRKGHDGDARLLLDGPPPDLVRPVKWWRERSILARRALRAGHVSEAYRIVSAHGLAEGREYQEAEWLAGWIMLRFLAEAKTAGVHFQALYRAARFPISQARGAYWAGRAAEANGQVDQARLWFARAARFPATFYGQLAAVRAAQKKSLNLPPEPFIDPIERAAFQQHDLVRAARLLVEAGLRDRIDPFIRRLNQIGLTPGWRALTAGLAGGLKRKDLAVWAAKRALRDGINMVKAGYPLLDTAPPPGLELPLIFAVIRQESAFRERAISRAGARGLMQIMPRTARRVAKSLAKPYGRDRLIKDSDYNLTLGKAYLSGLIKEFNGSYILALAAYNAGPNRVRRWLRNNGDPRDAEVSAVDWVEKIPFRETRNYVQRVIENLHVYRQRLGQTQLAFNPEGDLRR